MRGSSLFSLLLRMDFLLLEVCSNCLFPTTIYLPLIKQIARLQDDQDEKVGIGLSTIRPLKKQKSSFLKNYHKWTHKHVIMDFLKINGGHGEGGGQIVRSAIMLSCITGQPIHLENIRKNRRKNGLKPQHLTAIRIIQKISNSKAIGAEIGSSELKFTPGKIQETELVEDIGTAGSISLVLQMIIPILAISNKKLKLTLRGGTNVRWSPSIEYTKYILFEAYKRMGINFGISINRYGFYPKGRGEIILEMFPSKIKSLSLLKRKSKDAKMICTVSNLPTKKIEKEIIRIKNQLIDNNFTADTKIIKTNAADPGASILIYTNDENSIIGTDALFDEKGGKFPINVDMFVHNTLGVDNNLADMLVVPASLAQGKTVFRVPTITKHLESNLFVTSKITGCRYGIGKLQEGYEIIIEGISNSSI